MHLEIALMAFMIGKKSFLCFASRDGPRIHYDNVKDIEENLKKQKI